MLFHARAKSSGAAGHRNGMGLINEVWPLRPNSYPRMIPQSWSYRARTLQLQIYTVLPESPACCPLSDMGLGSQDWDPRTGTGGME